MVSLILNVSLGVNQNESQLYTLLRIAELKIIMGLSVSDCSNRNVPYAYSV
jgi:hypothetical protein